MTRDEFNALKSKVDTAVDLFSKLDGLTRTIAAVSKCYLTVHNADDVQAMGIRIKDQEAIRTIVIAQLNEELKEINQKIAEF